MKICIATSRPIGIDCHRWARLNHPQHEYVNRISEADLIVSVLYRKLIPAALLSGRRAYNFHVGLLPEYRGSGTNIWPIINGEKFTGITLHEIDAGIDTGPIIDAFSFKILPTDTGGSIMDKSERLIFALFKDVFGSLIAKNYVSVPQDPSAGHTYYRKDLEKFKDLTKFVRALTFPGKESCYYINARGHKIYLNL